MPNVSGITPDSKSDSIRRLLARQREEIDRQWQQRIDRFASRLETAWRRFSDDVEAATAEELPAEELAPLFTAFAKLRQLGVRFDPRFIARMEALQADAVRLDVDGDLDTSDELLDREDTDEDGSDEACEDGWGNHHTLRNKNGAVRR
jgi:hypothetical protein